MGEARRLKLLRQADGTPEEPFRMRIREPAWAQRRREKAEHRGVLIPVPASARKDRRLGKLHPDAPVNRPLTAAQIEQLHGPVREHNEGIRRGEIKKNQSLEITTMEEDEDAAPDREATPPAADTH